MHARQQSLTTGIRNHLFFGGRGFAEHQSNLYCSVNENSYNSCALWDIWIIFLHTYLF